MARISIVNIILLFAILEPVACNLRPNNIHKHAQIYLIIAHLYILIRGWFREPKRGGKSTCLLQRYSWTHAHPKLCPRTVSDLPTMNSLNRRIANLISFLKLCYLLWLVIHFPFILRWWLMGSDEATKGCQLSDLMKEMTLKNASSLRLRRP